MLLISLTVRHRLSQKREIHPRHDIAAEWPNAAATYEKLIGVDVNRHLPRHRREDFRPAGYHWLPCCLFHNPGFNTSPVNRSGGSVAQEGLPEPLHPWGRFHGEDPVQPFSLVDGCLLCRLYHLKNSSCLALGYPMPHPDSHRGIPSRVAV